MAGYEFHGTLCGFVCAACSEPLSGVKVRLYRAEDGGDVVARAVAAPKETFALRSHDDATRKETRLLAEVETDEHGGFIVELGEREGYEGGPFEVDVLIGGVPGQSEPPADVEPLQFTITTVQPRWRPGVAGGFIAAWEHCLSRRIWCGIRARFGAWAICGEVRLSEGGAPIAGLVVRAFDADWLQHDPLGTATTDAQGRFRIDYTVASFLKTPFSWLNVELTHGPDVYFHVETPSGTPLLTEPPARGREADRDNVGPCLCVELYVDEAPPPTGDSPVPMFTSVGEYDVAPASGHFTAQGTTTVGGFAFTGTIPLNGVVPDGGDPVAVRYRFLVEDLAGPGPVVVDGSMIAPTHIGILQYHEWDPAESAWAEEKHADVYVNNPAATTLFIAQPSGPPIEVDLNVVPEPDGWIYVPRHTSVLPGEAGLFKSNQLLANLDTTKLASESFDLRSGPPPLPIEAGEAVPAAQRPAKPTFRIVFEAQKVPGNVPIGSDELERIAISNVTYAYTRHPEWAGGDVSLAGVASLRIAEMVAPGGSGCDQIGDQLNALFTVYHPYMGGAGLSFEGEGTLPGPVGLALTDGEAAGSELFDISGLAPCAYILWLSATLDLTSGFGRIDGATLQDHIAFCKS